MIRFGMHSSLWTSAWTREGAENDPAGDLPTVSDIGGEGAEKTGDSPGPDVVGSRPAANQTTFPRTR